MILIGSNLYDSSSVVKVDWSEVPDYLYFTTFEEYLDDIVKYGLGSKSHRVCMGCGTSDSYDDFYARDGFFLAVSSSEALAYTETDERGSPILMRISKTALNKDRMFYDLNNEVLLDHLNGDDEYWSKSYTTYFYAGIIRNPQKVCEIVD